jgi:hypothetical protein
MERERREVTPMEETAALPGAVLPSAEEPVVTGSEVRAPAPERSERPERLERLERPEPGATGAPDTSERGFGRRRRSRRGGRGREGRPDTSPIARVAENPAESPASPPAPAPGSDETFWSEPPVAERSDNGSATGVDPKEERSEARSETRSGAPPESTFEEAAPFLPAATAVPVHQEEPAGPEASAHAEASNPGESEDSDSEPAGVTRGDGGFNRRKRRHAKGLRRR